MLPDFSRATRFALCMMGLMMSTTAASEPNGQTGDDEARRFIQEHEQSVRPLEIQAALTWWNANVTGRDADFQAKEEAQNRLDAALADRGRFAQLKALKDRPIKDPILAREVAVLYLQYLEKQVDPELLRKITAKANAIEQAFNGYRADVRGKKLTDSEVRRILKESRDPAERKAVWEASKGVGPIVEADLKALVKLRNEAARKLGFANFHALQLHLAEQSQEDVLRIFDELDALTREPFRKLKLEIDAKVADQSGIAAADVRPWHYHDPFFQEAPAIFTADFDGVYARADIL
ncbi:MAG: M2 family metallopeptidase [Isosphaeraceae bacterium]